ncbi:MAG: hypothetical protein PHQ96_07080, partial [Candidatus Omnitrophica bacterium]|nr:hypothetical protein [Candidatus Omnitrophota bacterium]
SISLLLLFSACQPASNQPAALRIGKVARSASEFDELFKNSMYGAEDTPESRKEFLENYIARMAILAEAERQGLHKEDRFLKEVELFWQQALMKLAIDKKMKEILVGTRISDAQMRAFYEAHKDTDFKDKAFEDVYQDIRWLLARGEQQKGINAWVESLKAKTKISIDTKALKIE